MLMRLSYTESVRKWCSAITTGRVSFVSYLLLRFSKFVRYLLNLGYFEHASSLAFMLHLILLRILVSTMHTGHVLFISSLHVIFLGFVKYLLIFGYFEGVFLFL